MPVFILGLLLGALSGGGTYLFTEDSGLSLLIGLAVAVAVWFGTMLIVVLDD